jgi:hypothetical protein
VVGGFGHSLCAQRGALFIEKALRRRQLGSGAANTQQFRARAWILIDFRPFWPVFRCGMPGIPREEYEYAQQ